MQAGPEIEPPTLTSQDGPRVRIVLIDSHAILRDGLKMLLEVESDFSVVGDYGCPERGLAGIRELKPDIALSDLSFPGRSGSELFAEVRRHSPLTRKLVLTQHDGEEYVRAALNAGADGYLLKESTYSELKLAIRAVAAGEQFLCRAVADKILSGYLSSGVQRSWSAVARTITGREREVLTRIALGNSNKLIARDLGLSPKTVEKHRSNLMRKLQLHNTAAITMFAIRNGLTGSDPFGNRPESREPFGDHFAAAG